MKYKNIISATFIERPNRFIAYVEIHGKKEICHVKNTGRCKELLIPGAKIYVQKSDNPQRKTKYDLIAVYKDKTLVNIDSQAPNKVVGEWLPHFFDNITLIKPESGYKSSRFDFYLEADGKKIFAEVKGVTLEKDGIAMFPDAPTERGVKHLDELCRCVKDGFEAWVFFVIQMKGIKSFCPNRTTHPEFADALIRAQENGVNVCCVDCVVKKDELTIDSFINYRL